MNIAIYSTLNLCHGGGGEWWIKQVALGLSRRKHRIMVLTTTYGNKHDRATKEALQEQGIDVREYDTIFGPFKFPKLSHFREIVKLLKDFDVLYFNNGFAFNELFVYLLKRCTRIKVISGIHGSFPDTGHYLRKKYHKIINSTISKTFDFQHVLNSERENIMKSQGYINIRKIPNGVNIQEFNPAQKEEIFTVMFAGRMTHQKGIDRFASAVDSLNRTSGRSGGRMRFVIFGVGPLSHIPKKLEEKYENVQYLDHVSRKDLIDTYQRSHLFVFPSRFEEFGLVCLEAQAAGTPVLASDIPGPREVIIDGVTGFLVNTNVPEETISVISYFRDLWYSKEHSKYQSYCLNSRRNALNYDWSSIIDSLEKTFASATCRIQLSSLPTRSPWLRDSFLRRE